MKNTKLFSIVTSVAILLWLLPFQADASTNVVPEDYNSYKEVNYEVERAYTDAEMAKLAEEESIPVKYDSRELNRITGVKDQNPYGTGWSFAAMAALEGSVLSQGLASDMDLSEYHFLNYNYQYVTDPLGGTLGDDIKYHGTMEDFLYGGGNVLVAYHALTNWLGATADTGYVQDVAYVMPKTTEAAYLNNIIHLEQFFVINKEDTLAVKEAIMAHGAVTASMGYYDNYMNWNTASYYNFDSLSANHVVAIVGWDDEYSKENFKNTPAKDGAWLVKNSWGTGFGKDGYFWMSYEDVSLREEMCALVASPADKYDHNYQYDGSYFNHYTGYGQDTMRAANVFKVPETAEKEVLRAVSIEVSTTNIDYELQIYKNPTDSADPTSGTAVLSTPVKGNIIFEGFHTVELPEMIVLNPGDVFSVVFTLRGQNGENVWVTIEYPYRWGDVEYITDAQANQSYIGTMTYWKDYGAEYKRNVRIKAFTCDMDNLDIVLVEEITLDHTEAEILVDEELQLTATVSPVEATYKMVTWESSDTNVATVDKNGKVTAVGPGEAMIFAVATDGSGICASCKVTVKQLVTAIKLDNTSLEMRMNETYTLQATVSPDNATNKALSWESSDTTVATVDDKGKVTAVGGGVAQITATAMDGSKVSASCEVKVLQYVTEIILDQTVMEIDLGDTYTLSATINPVSATSKKLDWYSTNSSVATVDENGKITAVSLGKTVIIAVASDGSGKSASCTVTVVKPVEFADVASDQWYYPYVKKAYYAGYMNGTGYDNQGRVIFKPMVNIPREQFVTVLYALEGIDDSSIEYSNRFEDVAENAWYAKPVEWAAQNGIVSGIGNGKFGVGQEITREQIAVMLYAYAKYKGYDVSVNVNITGYPDAREVSSWAYDGMRWAIQNGIMSGQKAGNAIYLKPQDKASRAVCATMIVAFAEKFKQ